MKALSLKQPYATLVVIGAKKNETRSWPTRYRGPLAIHAAKGFPRWAQALCPTQPFLSALLGAGIRPVNLPRGAIIGMVDLEDCLPIGPGFEMPAEPELSFGDYSMGRYVWVFANPRLLPAIVPCAGMLGLWETRNIEDAGRERSYGRVPDGPRVGAQEWEG